VPYGTSHRDFARIHSYATKRNDYCIEIKPKQGWWSKHLQAALEGLFLPSQCTYCLNQFLKVALIKPAIVYMACILFDMFSMQLKRSKIVSRTNYCPLDLFSGEPRRMVQAIVALISNPQNNFRIFKVNSSVSISTKTVSPKLVLSLRIVFECFRMEDLCMEKTRRNGWNHFCLNGWDLRVRRNRQTQQAIPC